LIGILKTKIESVCVFVCVCLCVCGDDNDKKQKILEDVEGVTKELLQTLELLAEEERPQDLELNLHVSSSSSTYAQDLELNLHASSSSTHAQDLELKLGHRRFRVWVCG
jgi:hypothetical protein